MRWSDILARRPDSKSGRQRNTRGLRSGHGSQQAEQILGRQRGAIEGVRHRRTKSTPLHKHLHPQGFWRRVHGGCVIVFLEARDCGPCDRRPIVLVRAGQPDVSSPGWSWRARTTCCCSPQAANIWTDAQVASLPPTVAANLVTSVQECRLNAPRHVCPDSADPQDMSRARTRRTV